VKDFDLPAAAVPVDHLHGFFKVSDARILCRLIYQRKKI
jgi:hypothetical protein